MKRLSLRSGPLTVAERTAIGLLATDQPSSSAADHLLAHSEHLARVMRRHPETIRRAIEGALVLKARRDVVIDALRAFGPSLSFIRSLLEEAVRTPLPAEMSKRPDLSASIS